MPDTIKQTGEQEVHYFDDSDSGLQALIVIDSEILGPAFGGCRFVHYPSLEAAELDARRLARGMTYKSALLGTPNGGGKSVIMRPNGDFDRVAIFRAMGQAIDSLGGRYVSGMDAGSKNSDMDIMRKETQYVTCTTTMGDPAVYTSAGIFAGIQACLKHRLSLESCRGITVAVLGVGHVGGKLCRLLADAGAELVVADVNPDLTQWAADNLGARVREYHEIHTTTCDVFAPCALGGVLTSKRVKELRCGIVAGAANNQIASPEVNELLLERKILYAPDFIINAGGLAFCAQGIEDMAKNGMSLDQRVQSIHDRLLEIFREADTSGKSTEAVALHQAETILEQAAAARQ